ncbi:hypothetical protein [Enterobacter cloacae]|uniref:hypothetical protein n=1 Tax=Enterobacter cloacae TaxID=550 RepID=UPI002FD8638A
MTVSKPMTGEQLDELMTVAVNMQRDSEKAGDRPAAMFAYAVQVAVLELRKVRNDAAALAAENAGLKELIEQHANSLAVCPNCSHEEPSETDDIVALYRSMETPATDAFLAEVRAQGVEMFAAHKRERQQALRSRNMRMSEEAAGIAADAEDFADQLRKGVQS